MVVFTTEGTEHTEFFCPGPASSGSRAWRNLGRVVLDSRSLALEFALDSRMRGNDLIH